MLVRGTEIKPIYLCSDSHSLKDVMVSVTEVKPTLPCLGIPLWRQFCWYFQSLYGKLWDSKVFQLKLKQSKHYFPSKSCWTHLSWCMVICCLIVLHRSITLPPMCVVCLVYAVMFVCRSIKPLLRVTVISVVCVSVSSSASRKKTLK